MELLLAILADVTYVGIILAIFLGADDPSEDRCDCSICNAGGGRHLPTQRKST